ncbi:hypothetical protein AT05_00685 [Schleiferia thermophila str. Yellowstone]|nr:hypothetical protein AT05_00685 [Schleiferia thermophila str. Yellowstone]
MLSVYLVKNNGIYNQPLSFHNFLILIFCLISL